MSGGKIFKKIMARKPRSQRRKKGGDGDTTAITTTTKNGDSSKDNSKDALSDTYTVDDNLSVLSFAEDFAFGGVGGGALSTVPYDWCIWLQ